MKGSIVRWGYKRGFGFINSSEFSGDIFVHISNCKKGYRSPQVGDEVEFQIHFKDGKANAKNVILCGVEPLPEASSMMSYILSFIIIVGIASYFAYQQFLAPKPYDNMGFSCQGKTYCSQMLSCEEAQFYLAYCPSVKIDGDRDGIPCESQLCGH